jgi:hypothetical protein
MGKVMSDSEEPKPIPVATPPGTSLVIVPTAQGGVREMIRNEKGHFVKKPKPLIPTVEFTRAERKKLNSVRADKDGMTEYMVAFTNLLRIAQHEGTDAKEMMAAVKAFEVLRTSALGKPAPSEQEMDKLQTQAVKVIVVQAPSDIKPMEQRPPEPKQPSFATVIDVKTNEK